MNITAIVIIAIICWMIVSIVEKVSSRKHQKTSNGEWHSYNQRTVELEEKIEVLEQRIAVLEKIVTDEKYDLKKEFEKL